MAYMTQMENMAARMERTAKELLKDAERVRGMEPPHDTSLSAAHYALTCAIEDIRRTMEILGEKI